MKTETILKYSKLTFVGSLIMSIGIIGTKTFTFIDKLNNFAEAAPNFNYFNHTQGQIGKWNVVLLIFLLTQSLWLFYLKKDKKPIILSNFVFIFFTLANYVTATKAFYKIQTLDNANTNIHIMTFIGLFYVIGAIVISVIGYIAIRNFHHRDNTELKKRNSN